ncbi:LAMI_0H00254g1_1 [Lachancea mirantina]|uniref:ubiquitinyl hydrolase 1 n=1 Tax=Lachancea mirantina TaxID=1230905 RepID=A0A1G4KDE5_9SACH|nr:LAMI_0H00254g1_1 [Lachancea mirantina]
MEQQEAIQPLIERILMNPLQFHEATRKDGVESKPGSCIVIGSGHVPALGSGGDEHQIGTGGMRLASTVGAEGEPASSKQRKTVRTPRSFSEALKMYTARKPAPDADLSDDKFAGSTDERAGHESGEESSRESSSGSEAYQEAREFTEDDAEISAQRPSAAVTAGEDLGEELGEEVGEELESEADDRGNSLSADTPVPTSVDDASDASDNADADYELEIDQEVSEDDDKGISDAERAGLLSEAQEYAKANEDAGKEQPEPGAACDGDDDGDELKHKQPQPKCVSPTPPTTLPDAQQFYLFNEEPNDRGSNSSTCLMKNWGPKLTALKPRGLLNHGVTCYTNAAVQAMLHIPAIQHYLFAVLRGQYKQTISQNSVTNVLAETSKRMWSPDGSKNTFVNPKKLIGKLDDINCMMSEWQQEDSHEYFMSLMSRLQEDGVPRGHKMTESIIYDIFGGMLCQEVTCKSCGKISRTEQPFYDLSLHLKGKKPPSNSEAIGENSDDRPSRRFSIEKSIRDFFNVELIKADKEGKNGYFCESCSQTGNALKHNSILRAPETLLVHLKKFRFNGTSSSKLKQAVSYPMFLDLTEFCENQEDTLAVKYQLISVVVHEGRSLSSGHYIAHCKQPDGSWSTYDDEYINKITDRQMLKEPNAYYLIYTRLTPKSVKWSKEVETTPLQASKANESLFDGISESSRSASKKKKKNHNRKKRRLNK